MGRDSASLPSLGTPLIIVYVKSTHTCTEAQYYKIHLKVKIKKKLSIAYYKKRYSKYWMRNINDMININIIWMINISFIDFCG